MISQIANKSIPMFFVSFIVFNEYPAATQVLALTASSLGY